MDFKQLNKTIPYAKGGKEKVLRMEPYSGVVLAMPGRHWNDTTPKGGDFVVMIDTPAMKEHQFKHDDIFDDIDLKVNSLGRDKVEPLMRAYLDIVTGGDPMNWDGKLDGCLFEGILPALFIRAVQCLSVAEHRRYQRFEEKIGGRYLPFRFAAGILEGEWSAGDCKSNQKYGRPGVESLERKYGLPVLTKELVDAVHASNK